MPSFEQFGKIHLKVGEENEDELLPVERRAAITAFRVFARLRPFIPEELAKIGDQPLKSTIEMVGDSTFPLNPNNDWQPSHEFCFDRSLWSIPTEQQKRIKKTPHFYDNEHKPEDVVGQERMYDIATTDEIGISMVDNAFMSINSCVLTYGQTSSGKTHTMMGRYGEGCDPADRGIIPRVCDELFQKVKERREHEEKKPEEERWQLKVTVTFVEIYLEKVRDLLDPSIKKQAQRAVTSGGDGRGAAEMKEALGAMKEARVRRDPELGPFVEGVKTVTVNSWDDCRKVLERGAAHRTTAITTVHDNSSRSHAIFTITLVQKRVKKQTRDGPEWETRTGRMNLVDLAGSERGGGTEYVKESAAINKSLMALRRVIDALIDRQEKIFQRHAAELEGRGHSNAPLPHVPYLDSVLTQLLEDSIGGNSKTVMISNMTPYWDYYEETLRTLEWSQKAKKLVAVVRTNIDEAGMVKDALNAKIGAMGNQLNQQKASMEGLTKELENRQKMIAALEEKNRKTQARIDALHEKFNIAREQRAATIIQLAFYLHNFKQTRLRRRAQVAEAEGAAGAARKELEALEERHEALLDALMRQNITMGRIKQKADDVAAETDETIKDAQSKEQRKPDDLRRELEEKKNDVKDKRDELVELQKQQQKADELMAQYQTQREREETRIENERLEAEDRANEMKNDILSEILGVGSEGEYSKVLKKNVNVAGSKMPLFKMGADGKWVASDELTEQLEGVKTQKDEADTKLLEQEKAKKEAEQKKGSLQGAVAAEQAKVDKLQKSIATINKQIAESNAAGPCCKPNHPPVN